jgi:DNA adenine methylase
MNNTNIEKIFIIKKIKVNKKKDKFKLVKDINNNSKIDFVKPFIKWVGGKSQILDKIIQEFPTNINNYHEIFLGGGSVLLSILSLQKENIIKINKIYAYDLNEPLINLYINIQKNPFELYNKIQELIIKYNNCSKLNVSDKNERNPKNENDSLKSKESFYYWIRNNYNSLNNEQKNSIDGSSIFLFLNKTCFRGLFRIGPNGFNVSFGNYEKPEIVNKEHILAVSNLIKNVEFICLDFNKSLNILIEKKNKDDFIYLDPPYAPENNKSFVGYNENDFNLDNHLELFKKCNEINKNKIKFILSNSDVKLVRDNFSIEKFNINSILCKRTINSKNPDAKTKEVIIKNY